MKSSRGIGSRRSCRRRSGVVSMRKYLPRDSIFTDCRRRLSRGSSDAQTRHGQPTTGTPVDVPVPRKVTIMSAGFYAGRAVDEARMTGMLGSTLLATAVTLGPALIRPTYVEITPRATTTISACYSSIFTPRMAPIDLTNTAPETVSIRPVGRDVNGACPGYEVTALAP